MQAPPDLHVSTRRLAHNATFVGILPALLLGVALAVVLHPIAGIALAVLGSLLWVVVIRQRITTASQRMVASLGAVPLGDGEAPRLENLLEALCLSSGVAEPNRWILDEPSINALVAASAERVDLVVTRGLLDGLDRLEMEGVLANLLGRVRDGSAEALTLIAALGGDSGPARAWRERHLGEQWLVRSDLAAVDLTRYPPGLHAALSTMASIGTAVPGMPASSSCSWLVPPTAAADERAAHGDGLQLRLAVLAEL